MPRTEDVRVIFLILIRVHRGEEKVAGQKDERLEEWGNGHRIFGLRIG